MSLDTLPIKVYSTERRGFTPEELAEQAADKIISISDTAPEAIRQQAQAFRKQLVVVMSDFLHRAVNSDRTTVYNALQDAGQPELADLIRRL